MRRLASLAAFCALTFPLVSHAADGDVSVARGLHVSIIGGCHDCHTANYNETNGQIDPALALKGTAIGWRGPWGTTYPLNLLITASDKTEDEFVEFASTFETRPPMPWYNVRELEESDVRSLYQYIKSLGDPGDPTPEAVGPDEEPTTPYYPLIPPTMPKM